MNKYEPVSSGLFSVLLQDAAFDGTLPATLSAELGRLLPPSVVVSLLRYHRREEGTRTVIYPPQASGPPQRFSSVLMQAEQTLEGTVYCGDCHGDENQGEGPESFVRLVLQSSRQRRTEIELRFSTRRADHQRTECMRLMGAIGPDLILVFRIAELQERATAAARLTDALLEILPFPTFLIDRRGGLRRSNVRGAALLAQGTALIAGADGRIHAADRALNADLHGALGGQVADRRDAPSTVPSSGMVMTLPAGRERVLITIRRLVGPGELPADPTKITQALEEPTTILVAQRTTVALTLRREILQTAFDLTPREVDLAQSLLDGESIGTHAQRQRLSKQTLRNQLSGVLRKTGTKRQTQLIGLLTRLAFAPSA